MIKFFKKLFGLDVNYTEQEKTIRNIFNKLMDMPNTDKVLVNSNCAYLSNNEMHICAAIDGDDVIIENENETISIRCSPRFMMELSDFVGRTLERNVSNMYKRMYVRQTDSLNAIDLKLCSTMPQKELDSSTISIEA